MGESIMSDKNIWNNIIRVLHKKETKTIVIALLMLFVTIKFVLAVPSISFNYPNGLTYYDLEVYTGITSDYQLSITNNGNYNLQNIEVTDLNYFTFNEVESLLIGETKPLNFSVKTTSVFENSFATTIYFDYLMPYEVESNTVTIYVNGSGFYPNNIDAYQQKSTVKWQNTDSVTHNVISITPSGLINAQILSGQSYTKTFSTIQNINYYDSVTGYSANLNIINKTVFEPTHSSSYDKPFLVQLKSLYRPTDVDMELYTTSLTANWNDEIQGVLRVINKLNETAHNLKLELTNSPIPTEIEFEKNNFNLNEEEYEIISFILIPELSITDETNKTYTYTLKLTGDNIVPNEAQFNITIRYFNFESGDLNLGCTVDWNAKKDFCKSYPTSPYCITEPIIQNKTVEIYKCPPELVNITPEKFSEVMDSVAILETLGLRMENRYKDTDYLVESMLNKTVSIVQENQQLQSQISNLTEQLLEKDKSRKTGWKVFWILLILCLFFIGIGYFVTKYVRKMKSERGA